MKGRPRRIQGLADGAVADNKRAGAGAAEGGRPSEWHRLQEGAQGPDLVKITAIPAADAFSPPSDPHLPRGTR